MNFGKQVTDALEAKAKELGRKLKYPEEWWGVIEGVGRPARKKKTDDLSDQEWVAMLEGEPHLKGIDIKREINACQFWCRNNKKLPTRRRIINWLSKAERVVDLKASGAQYATGLKPLPPMPPEPNNWRETFPDFIHAGKSWPEIDRTAQIYIADQMRARQQA